MGGEQATLVATLLSFATRAEGPLQRLTRRRPGLAVDAYPVGGLMLLRCSGDVRGVEREAEFGSPDRELLHTAHTKGEVTLVLKGASDGEDVVSALSGNDAHVVPPIRWQRGEAFVSVMLEDGARADRVLAKFPQARLVSKRRSGAVSSPLFLPKLTEKQARALSAAIEAGYYNFPRGVTTDEISRTLGVARTTFQEHLSRAENQVVKAMLPMVRARAGDARGEALEVYAKFSRELGLYIKMELFGNRVAGVTLERNAPRELAGDDHPYLARILEHVRTGEGDLRDIPLHLEVTPFEREVLDYLRAIPPGATLTYGEIARGIGRPGASRAVGSACAHNPAVIVVPCHRVVPKSGGLGNYSGEGGSETKRKLLEREGAEVDGTRKRAKGKGYLHPAKTRSTIDDFTRP